MKVFSRNMYVSGSMQLASKKLMFPEIYLKDDHMFNSPPQKLTSA